MVLLRAYRFGLVIACLTIGAACGAPLVVTHEPVATVGNASQWPVTASAPPAPTLSADAAATRAAIAPVTLAESLPLIIWQATENRHVLVPVHPLTGEPLAGYAPIDLRYGYNVATAPDGNTLAIVAFASEDHSRGGEVLLIDLANWDARPTGIVLDDYPIAFQFAPDGESLLIGETKAGAITLRHITAATGQEAARTDLPFYPHTLTVTPDGTGVMVYGTQGEADSGLNPTAWAARLNLTDLSQAWLTEIEGVREGQYAPAGLSREETFDQAVWYGPGYAWAPEGTQLYLVHADSDRLTTVDFAAETVASVNIAPAQTWLDRLMALTAGVAEAKMVNGTMKQAVISRDGERLYVVGVHTDMSDSSFSETPLGLSVVDVATGELLTHIDTAARNVSLSPDGDRLLLEAWGETSYAEMRQVDDLSVVVKTMFDVYLRPVRLLNGEWLLMSALDKPNRTEFHVLDPVTFDMVAFWTTDGYGYPLLAP